VCVLPFSKKSSKAGSGLPQFPAPTVPRSYPANKTAVPLEASFALTSSTYGTSGAATSGVLSGGLASHHSSSTGLAMPPSLFPGGKELEREARERDREARARDRERERERDREMQLSPGVGLVGSAIGGPGGVGVGGSSLSRMTSPPAASGLTLPPASPSIDYARKQAATKKPTAAAGGGKYKSSTRH
jgi:hypothetical protein